MGTKANDKPTYADPVQSRNAMFRASSFKRDATGRPTVEVIMATETPVRRYGIKGPNGEYIGEYNEVLVCTPEAVNRTYIDPGMSVCDTHNQFSIFGILGTVDAESVRFEERKLVATLGFSRFAIDLEVDKAVEDKDVKFTSVSYDTLGEPEWDMTGEIPTARFKWMPLEVSWVAVPADPNAVARMRSKFSAAMQRSQQEKTMPTEAEIAAARALLASVETEAEKAARAKAEADAAAAAKIIADKAAADLAEAERVAAEAARAKAGIAVDAPEYVTLMTAARGLGESVVKAVSDAQAIGGNLEDCREAAKHAMRSRPQPKIDTSIPAVKTDTEQRSHAPATTLDAGAIWAELRKQDAERRSRH